MEISVNRNVHTVASDAFRIMDEAEAGLLRGEIDDALTNLTLGLKEVRDNAKPEVWRPFASDQFSAHPLVSILHQDPFTRHSFNKPRGYSGDADLIDYMYGERKPGLDITQLGLRIFDYTTNTPAPQSVRDRREIIAKMIDELSEKDSKLRVLSIACGHLREAAISAAVADGKVTDFFALDQDALSLEVVKRDYADLGIKTINSPIKKLFANKPEFDGFDFAYAAGLYDYLPQPVAIRLTRIMFDMVKPGGKILAANFAPCLRDIAYLETFMQWNLIYRIEAEVSDFASGIDRSEIASQRIFRDKGKNVIYLEIIKK